MRRLVLIGGENFVYGLRILLGTDGEKVPRCAHLATPDRVSGGTHGKKIEKMIHEYKHVGKFKSRKQAIAAGLNTALEKGERVPKQD